MENINATLNAVGSKNLENKIVSAEVWFNCAEANFIPAKNVEDKIISADGYHNGDGLITDNGAKGIILPAKMVPDGIIKYQH